MLFRHKGRHQRIWQIFKLCMGVPKNSGTPKWMVYNGKPYLLMDDLGRKPHYFRKHPANSLIVVKVPYFKSTGKPMDTAPSKPSS